MVARDYIPNTQRSYKRLGNLVSNARRAGLIDWHMIEDRNRGTSRPSHWSDPGEIIKAALYSFRIDKWEDQPVHVEVMVEKDALSGVLEPVCRDLDIGITANKGYSSSSMMYVIGKRFQRMAGMGKDVCVLYLGDHDPSGIDMTRDVFERIELYSRGSIEMVRLALNMDQIDMWQPPENPAKESDSRFSSYVDLYGSSSWELDAVEPSILANLVRTAVLERRDEKLWKKAIRSEDKMRDELREFADRYGDV